MYLFIKIVNWAVIYFSLIDILSTRQLSEVNPLQRLFVALLYTQFMFTCTHFCVAFHFCASNFDDCHRLNGNTYTQHMISLGTATRYFDTIRSAHHSRFSINLFRFDLSQAQT